MPEETMTARRSGRAPAGLASIQLPARIRSRIARVAKSLHATETELVVAVLESGLELLERASRRGARAEGVLSSDRRTVRGALHGFRFTRAPMVARERPEPVTCMRPHDSGF